MYRRRLLAAIYATDPYMQGMRGGGGMGGPDRGALGGTEAEADPYSRPPPEFYQRRGRGGRAATSAAATSAASTHGTNGAYSQAARPA